MRFWQFPWAKGNSKRRESFIWLTTPFCSRIELGLRAICQRARVEGLEPTTLRSQEDRASPRRFLFLCPPSTEGKERDCVCFLVSFFFSWSNLSKQRDNWISDSKGKKGESGDSPSLFQVFGNMEYAAVAFVLSLDLERNLFTPQPPIDFNRGCR